MEKQVLLDGIQINYLLRISPRAKRMRITVSYGGNVVVTVPVFFKATYIEKFVTEQSSWILRSITRLKNTKKPLPKKEALLVFKKYKNTAKIFVEERIKFFNQYYNLKYKKITIRDQKTRWGSCSKEGNLSFNYKILHLPLHLADYIVVHELCHLRELNHSQKFWNLVATTFPNYKILRQELKLKGLTL